jgi:hypothetical protein
MPIDIHSPSISSNAQPETWVVPDSKDGLLELIKEKDKVEAEMRALGEVLDSVSIHSIFNILHSLYIIYMAWKAYICFH